MDNIELEGFSMHQQNREATSGKTRGGVVCLFVYNSWCSMSNITEVSRYCSPEVEYLMKSCRPHYLPRESPSILLVAVYLPPQTDAGTKTAINQLYKAISNQENAHTMLVPASYLCNQRENKSQPPLLHTQMHTKLSPYPHLENLTIILSS
jgi:hypothetical protein